MQCRRSANGPQQPSATSPVCSMPCAAASLYRQLIDNASGRSRLHHHGQDAERLISYCHGQRNVSHGDTVAIGNMLIDGSVARQRHMAMPLDSRHIIAPREDILCVGPVNVERSGDDGLVLICGRSDETGASCNFIFRPHWQLPAARLPAQWNASPAARLRRGLLSQPPRWRLGPRWEVRT